MERTNYVSKAKALIQRTARTTALVIVPLAAAVSAHAGAVLPTSNFSCILLGSASGSCTSGASVAQLNSGSGITGVSFFADNPVFMGASSSGSAAIEMWAGTPSFVGPLNQNIPLQWDFSAEALSGGTVTGWSLVMELGTGIENHNYGIFNTSGSGASGSGSGSMTIASGGVASGVPVYETWQLALNYTDVVEGLEVSIPAGPSVDYQSAAAVGVPEPASLGLIGSGLALLGLLRRRRGKS